MDNFFQVVMTELLTWLVDLSPLQAGAERAHLVGTAISDGSDGELEGTAGDVHTLRGGTGNKD